MKNKSLIKSLLLLTSIVFMSGLNAQSYCTPGGSNSSRYINSFSTSNGVQNITNINTGYDPSGYGDYTSMIVEQNFGGTINFQANLGASGTYGFRIWIDWNQDGQFDASEVAYQSSSYSSSHSGSFTVPLSATPGPTRMRIGNSYTPSSGPSNPCETGYSSGEFEDYTFLISLPDAPSISQAAGTPACTTGSDLTASGTLEANETWYWQTTADGTDMTNNASSPWKVFSNGTYYVRTYDSNYNVWSYADSIQVTNFPTETAPFPPIADQNPACLPGTNLVVPGAPPGITYYWQGTNPNGTATTDNASSPFFVDTTGRYFVRAYNNSTECWSDTVGVSVIVKTDIPEAPLVDTVAYHYCDDITSAIISASASVGNVNSLATGNQTGGNSCGGGVMFDITNDGQATVTITELDALFNGTSSLSANVYYMTSPYSGSETTASNWTLLGSYTASILSGEMGRIDIDDFDIPAGATYGVFINYNAKYTTLSGLETYSNADITISAGTGLCSPFSGINNNRGYNGTVHYKSGFPSDLVWYDAATGGNVLGNGNTLETVGTSVLPSVAIGSYDFYAASTYNGCEALNRVQVTVNISEVNVMLEIVDASCNNGNDGSFVVDSIECGDSPFTFSVDGSSFGAIPTDLSAGSHTVIIKDANGMESTPYILEIGSASGPSAVISTGVSAYTIDLGWVANGSETAWNIEWGVPGFVPGTGNELGSVIATSNPYTITGLNANTSYDVYVSANCGQSSSPGDWEGVENILTDCGIQTAPFRENFDNGVQPLCWSSTNNLGSTSVYASWMFSGNPDYGASSNGRPAGTFAWTDGSSTAPDSIMLVTPPIDLSSLSTPYLSFEWFSNNTTYPGDHTPLIVEIFDGTYSWFGSSWTLLDTLQGVDSTGWMFTNYDLSAYKNDTVQIRFMVNQTVTNNSAQYHDVLLDNVVIDNCKGIGGQDGTLDICRYDDIVNLNDNIISKANGDGKWSFPSHPSYLTQDSIFNVSNLPIGSHEVYYVEHHVCFDTTVATINIHKPSSAGIGTSIDNVCMNGPIDLLSGLDGSFDTDGTWYDSDNNPLPNAQPKAEPSPGQYTFTYVVDNGVCPADTAIVIVTVDDCDHLSIGEELFNNISVYPNPTTNQLNIVNPSITSDLKVEILDMNGRVVLIENKGLNSASETTLVIDHLEKGIYTLRVYNNEGQKVFKIVKQ